jgi:hypothetical protein
MFQFAAGRLACRAGFFEIPGRNLFTVVFSFFFAVNNLKAEMAGGCGFTGESAWSTIGSRAVFGGQVVHIKSWAEFGTVVCCGQFIERTKRAAKSKIDVVRFKIIPGDWGKAGSGWLPRLLLKSAPQGANLEAEFTSSSGGVRTPSNANEGLGSKRR